MHTDDQRAPQSPLMKSEAAGCPVEDGQVLSLWQMNAGQAACVYVLEGWKKA